MEVYDFGLRLRNLRTKRKLSQAEVASRLELTSASISAYENNVAIPPSDILRKLALMFNVSADYLLGLEDHHQLFLPSDLPKSRKDMIERFLDIVLNEC